MVRDTFAQLLASIQFSCYSCGKKSGCGRIAKNRDEVDRIASDPNRSMKVSVFCEHCGAANEIDISASNISSSISIGNTDAEGILSDFLRRR